MENCYPPSVDGAIEKEQDKTSNILYLYLLETGSLDNAIQDFSLALPLWYMSQ